MNIILKVKLFIKAKFGKLSTDEFTMLAEVYHTEPRTKDYHVSKKILSLYFKNTSLTPEIADIVGKASYQNVQNLFLENKKGPLSEIEQAMLVRQMKWDIIKRFSAPLDEPFIAEMFERCEPLKIIAYCLDFQLPEKWEHFLFGKYQESLKTPDEQMKVGMMKKTENGWHKALAAYLSGGFEQSRMAGADMQQKILELQDNNLLLPYLKRCTMAYQPLTENSWRYLLENKHLAEIRLLLKRSYAPETIATDIKVQFPELEWALLISQKRYRIYLMEKEYHLFFGAQAPTHGEYKVIMLYTQSEGRKDEDIKLFCSMYIEPLLSELVSPTTSAWIAYHFPKLEEKAYHAMRRYVEKVVIPHVTNNATEWK